MKIKSLEYRLHQNTPKVSFRIALTEQATNDTVWIKIETDSGITGYGEACPFEVVTADNYQTIIAYLERIRPFLIGEDPHAIPEIHRMMDRVMVGNSSAKAAIDMALYDICAKAAKLPLYRYLGGKNNRVQSDMTIGIDEPVKMAEMAEKYVAEGFGILKVKVGLCAEDDLEAIRLIREAVGDEVELRLDANQGWEKKEAMNVLKKLSAYDVEEIEQPLPHHDLTGMAFLVQHCEQIIMADESVHSPEDAMRVIRHDACDMINIKLTKAGGIYKALAINSIAEAANISCMVGCMSESRLGISAATAFAASRRNITYCDLDSHRLNEEDPAVRGGFVQEGPWLYLSEEPGLGLEVDF